MNRVEGQFRNLRQNTNQVSFLIFFRFTTADRLSVRVGSSYRRDGGSLVQVKRIIEHENYKYPRHDYDVSLLELDQPVNFNDSIQTVALPNENTNVPDGTPCVVTGWGNS